MFDEDVNDPYPKYRIYAQKSGVATVYSMHETVYDFDRIPLEYSKVPVSIISLDPSDMIEEIEHIRQTLHLILRIFICRNFWLCF